MFLDFSGVGALQVIFCCLGDVVGDQWAFWDVMNDELLAADRYWDEPKPFDRCNKNLGDFTAVIVTNFDQRLNIGRLEAMFPNVTELQLQQCDMATKNSAFKGQTMQNIRRLWIGFSNGDNCPNVVDVAPTFTVANAFPLLEEFELWQHKFRTVPRQFVPSPNLKKLEIVNAGLEQLPNDFFFRLPDTRNDRFVEQQV